MRAHYLQHEPHEGPGSIQPWLAARGFEVRGTMVHEGEALPDIAAFDFLIVMGGGMSANDERRLPWLRAEKALIREAIDAGRKVLGVCLGAQLIASALGARVYRNAEKEIGWHEIRAAETPDSRAFRFPAACEVFHWHGETFDLPSGAVLLASSEACRHQAFQIGSNVIGLQFHLETTPEGVLQFVTSSPGDLESGRYVQSGKEILSCPAEKYQRLNALMGQLLAHLLQDTAVSTSSQR